MSVEREPIVPDPIWARLHEHAAVWDRWTVLLLTVPATGHPHQSMLSWGEVAALDREHLDLAIWPESTAARTLDQRPEATLTTVVDDTSWVLSVRARAMGLVEPQLGRPLRRFRASVVRVTADQAPYARLTSGVTFELKEPPAVHERWRETRAILFQGVS